MTTSPANIDYDAILQGLIPHCDHNFKAFFSDLRLLPAQALRELRTVGITTPRQSGKTSWMMRKLAENLDSFAVVQNRVLRDHILRKVEGLDESRIITSYDAFVLRKKMEAGQDTGWVWRSTVYIDDSSAMLDGHLKDFYKWLALNPEWEKMIVIRLS